MTLFGVELNLLRGIVLIALMLAFGGIWAWAWSSKRKETFRQASRLPLEEDDGEIPAGDRPGDDKE